MNKPTEETNHSTRIPNTNEQKELIHRQERNQNQFNRLNKTDSGTATQQAHNDLETKLTSNSETKTQHNRTNTHDLKLKKKKKK